MGYSTIEVFATGEIPREYVYKKVINGRPVEFADIYYDPKHYELTLVEESEAIQQALDEECAGFIQYETTDLGYRVD